MAILFNAGRFKATDKANDPIPGAFLAFYATNTSTFQPVYADSALTTVLTNPVQADANGLFPEIWLDDSLAPYKVIHSFPDINDPTQPGSVIWTIPQYNATLSGAALGPLINPQTQAEIDSGVTPVNLLYPPYDLRRLGVVGNGNVDDTLAVQNACLIGGEWYLFPGAQVLCTATITITKSISFRGDSSVTPTPTPGSTQCFFIHNFSGTFFDLVGLPSNQILGAGTRFSGVSFVQKHGNGSGASGACIRNVQVSATQECPWLRIDNCHFEVNSGANDWTYCIQADGTNQVNPANLRDFFIENCRFVSGTHATASVLLNGVANIWLTNCEGNLANSNLVITGSDASHPSLSIFLSHTTWSAIQLDFATGVYGAGNKVSTFTSTANTIDVFLGVSVAVSQTISGTRVTIQGEAVSGKSQWASNNNVRFETGTNPVEIAQVLAVGTAPAASGDVRINNSATIVGRNAANSGDIPALSVDSSNRVHIAPNGDDICWGRAPVALGGGAAATLGTIGGSGPTTAAQFEWEVVYDTAGNKCFRPLWK